MKREFLDPDVARARLFSEFTALTEETLHISMVSGRTAACRLKARNPYPPIARSKMDGYAVLATDTKMAKADQPVLFTVIESIGIEQITRGVLSPGTAIELATGSLIPRGANAIVKVEDVVLHDGTPENLNTQIQLLTPLEPGENVLSAGEDIPKGLTIIDEGETLRAQHVSVLCTLGYEEIKVRKRPRVVVIGIGDELRPVGSTLAPGQVYSSNIHMVCQLVESYGGIQECDPYIVPDEFDLIADRLTTAIKTADLVLTCGGTSVGKKDYLTRVLREKGDVLVPGIAQRPGGSTIIARVGRIPVIALPGYPMANYVSFVTVVGPFIRHLQGASNFDPRQKVFGILAHDIQSSGRPQKHFVQVRLEDRETGYLVHSLKNGPSGIMGSLTQMDGILEVPATRPEIKAGTVVQVFLNP